MKITTLVLLIYFLFVGIHLPTVNAGGDKKDSQSWQIVLVSKKEPGIPMIISGTVYGPDGKTPLSGIKVHAYHTDAEGYYSRGGRNENQHRIKGDMITNSEGKYEFRSIKPASYPNSRVASHVHYVVSGKGFPIQRFNLEFKGDPHISDEKYQREAKNDKFADIIPLEKGEDGILRGEFNIKLRNFTP